MTYSPQPGDIGLTAIRGGTGAAIRAAQWLNGGGYANYEHAFGVYAVTGGVPQIVEAEPGGALPRSLHYTDVAWLPCPDAHRDTVAAAYVQLIGVGYSFLDYASLAARRLHIPAPGLRRYISSTGHEICSQLVDAAAAEGGWHLFLDGRWPGDVTPADIWQLGHRRGALVT